MPIKFQVSWPFQLVRRISKWIFMMAALASILDFQLEQCQLFLIYKSPWCFLPDCQSIGISLHEKMFKTDFQHGGYGDHLGFPIRKILATSDLQVTPILLIKFWVNWPFCSGDVQNRFSIWQLRRPSWISNQINLSYFWPTSCPDTSYQFFILLAFPFRRRRSI